MSFAGLEQRVNAVVIRRLWNARAQAVGAPADFPVIFDKAFQETGPGVGATVPVATTLDTNVVGFSSNVTQLVIDGAATYLVRDLQPDGTGMTLIVLEAV